MYSDGGSSSKFWAQLPRVYQQKVSPRYAQQMLQNVVNQQPVYKTSTYKAHCCNTHRQS